MSNQVWIWVVTALKVSLRDWLSGLAWQGGGGGGVTEPAISETANIRAGVGKTF